jgi:hypothetical protein
LIVDSSPNRYPNKAPGAGRHREKLVAIADQRGGGAREDCADELRDFLDACGVPPASIPGESMPYKLSG